MIGYWKLKQKALPVPHIKPWPLPHTFQLTVQTLYTKYSQLLTVSLNKP